MTRPTDDEISERLNSPKAKAVREQILARVRAGNPMTYREIAEAFDVPVDVVLAGFMHNMQKAQALETAAKAGQADHPVVDDADRDRDREFDLALIDVVAKVYERNDVASELRARLDLGAERVRVTEVARVLGVTLDELLKEYLEAIESRTGVPYHVVGLLFQARPN